MLLFNIFIAAVSIGRFESLGTSGVVGVRLALVMFVSELNKMI